MAVRIILLGGPGAGKGTQAERVAERLRLPHISTGDIFRKHLKEGTAVGKQVKQYLDSGKLVPDEVTCAIVADRLAEGDCAAGCILDGFPRSLPQAENLDQLLAERGQSIDMAINLDVPDDEIVDRLSARRTCAVCGAIYSLNFELPPGGRICGRNGCTGPLVQRADDQEATIRQRLQVYHETTEPIISYYEQKGLLKKVPGSNATPDGVFSKIEEFLRAAGAL